MAAIYAEHQIMFDEAAEDLAELAAEYHEHHSPANPDQRLLVDILIHNEWRLHRMRRVEAVLWEHAADSFLSQHPEAEACNSAHAFATGAGYFERQVARGHALRSSQPGAGPTSGLARAPQPATAPEPAHPRNPNHPKPVPRIWYRSAKIRKPHIPSRRAPSPHAGPPAPASPAGTRSSTSDHNPNPPQTT